MSRAALIERLQRQLGLDPQSIGELTLHHTIDEARATLECTDLADLHARVTASPAEWQRFVDCMVVPETWFFRVPEQFADLARFARVELADRRPLRVLSLPCSTGEEAYSIAACLIETGLAPGSFEVLGIDVSERAVAHARRAVYRPHSLRGGNYHHWFEASAGTLQPIAAVQRSVRFRVGNILHSHLFAASERFDVVFCRNLLIYLDKQSRHTAMDQILSVLDTPGLILAGQAEALASMDTRLQPAPGYGPLSYSRSSGLPRVPAGATDEPVLGARARAQTMARAPRPLPPPAAAVPDSPKGIDLWTQACQDADAGRLDQARAGCLDLIERDAESAPTWFLLGTVELASGRWEAADAALARASYLDPMHLEALRHRAALCERLGRHDVAAALRGRLRRLNLPGTIA